MCHFNLTIWNRLINQRTILLLDVILGFIKTNLWSQWSCLCSHGFWLEHDKKDIVFGYIKKINKNKNKQIPELIYYICLWFYYEQEIFDKNLCSKGLKLSGKCNNIITKTVTDSEVSNVFGTTYFKSNTNEVLTWIIMFVDCDGLSYPGIGIVKNNPFKNINSYMYYFDGLVQIKNEIKPNCGIYCDKGETIKFIIDFKKSQLKICKNEKWCIICNHLEINENIKINVLPDCK